MEMFIDERRQQFRCISEAFENLNGAVFGQNIFQDGFVPYKVTYRASKSEVLKTFLGYMFRYSIEVSNPIFIDLDMFKNIKRKTKLNLKPY